MGRIFMKVRPLARCSAGHCREPSAIRDLAAANLRRRRRPTAPQPARLKST
jgi:hypothetical protein